MSRLASVLAVLVVLVGVILASASPIIREPGAIYLSDFAMKPLRLKMLEPARSFFDISQQRYAGTLRFPQIVQVEAVGPDGLYRVRGNAQQGGVVAWVNRAALETPPEKFVESLEKANVRRIEVEALIARNEVAIGMIPEEVTRSLGKPQKKTNRANKDATQQIWEYIKYDLVPQTTYAPGVTQTVVKINPGANSPGGSIVQTGSGITSSTIYIKVPVGTLTVTFKDGIVEALDQSEGTTTGGQVSVVIPPINVY